MTRTGVLRRMCIVVLSVATVAIPAIGQRASAAPSAGGATIHHGKLVSPKSSLPARDLPRSSPGKHQAVPRFQIPRATAKPAGGNHASRPYNTTMPAPSVTFKGLDFNAWGAGWPPDTVGDVGPNHYVQAVNTSIGIYNKTGTRLDAFTFDDLWTGTGTPCDAGNSGDVTVVYEPMADRFIVGDFAWDNFAAGPYYECIAVSKTSDPTGAWWLYPVRADDGLHPWLPDYPKMGIWPDGLYMTANMFCLNVNLGCNAGGTYEEVRAWAFNLTDLESGASVRSVVSDVGSDSYFSLLPSNFRGTSPPAGRENLLVSESETDSTFEVWKFHVDYSGSGSTFSGPTNVSQAAHTLADSLVPTPGNSLDALADRVMMQNQYKNIGGVESLWVNHAVKTGSSGTAPNGIQWAQVNVTGGTISTTPVQQQIYGNVGSDGLDRWMGSLAVDREGHGAGLQRRQQRGRPGHPLQRAAGQRPTGPTLPG